MLIRVDHASDTPLYSQIAAEIRSGVARGAIAEGEKLPAARTLAESLGVNMHTVLRAYGQLKEEGLLQMRQGTGAAVRKGSRKNAGRVEKMAERLVSYARAQGLSRADLLAVIERL